ncbi:MAG TPA: ATP-binding cassette domain-containing protein, partial [Armatimonadota bacterium]
MATLLSCEQVGKSFGSRPLFQGITLGIGDGDRIGLIGPNGSGKSTLVRILAGLERPDSGTVSGRRGLRVGYLAQEEEFDAGLTCEDAVAQVLASQPLDELEKSVRISASLGRVGFAETGQQVDTLSGGWRKRLSLACQLALEPDIMLLDEPTNHLDLEGIEYLEQLLRAGPLPFLLVSHDRYFLENVTNRLIELNPAYPDGCLVAQGSYSDFLIQREEFLQAQARQQESLESRVKREVEWLRKSAPARSTKPGARIREAGRLLEELDELKRRNSEGRSADLSFSATKRRTKELVSTKGLTMALGGRSLFSRLNLVLSPGMRMGVVGPNGGGKTTLLRLLNGDLAPDRGEVRRADGLRAVYFCQDREHL